MITRSHTIVLAPDSFKGSISAADAAWALAEGWCSVDPSAQVLIRPMADGGEGTLQAFAAAVSGATEMAVNVMGPHGRTVATSWLLLPPTQGAPNGSAVVELASTSGIEVLGSDLRPFDAHTGGFGEAIGNAIDHGVSRLILGIGGSSSTDGGAGLLASLGARFTDAAGEPIRWGARGLQSVVCADLSRLRPPPPGGVTVLSDVTNPLLGASGAARVFGHQKGFDAVGVESAEAGLTRLAGLLAADPNAPGAGAAGGAGFGLLAWGARLAPGAPIIADLIGLRSDITGASLVITGEGAFDGQSAAGKAPFHVGALAAEARVPVALVAGRVAPNADTTAFASCISLTELAGSAEAAMADPARSLRQAGAALALSISKRS